MNKLGSNTESIENKVVVYSAVQLKSEELHEIKVTLEEKLNREITIDKRVDKSIIAGLYIRFGDQVFDRTLKTKIERLRERLFS
jgi:ATP synthase F1 delta subunit